MRVENLTLKDLKEMCNSQTIRFCNCVNCPAESFCWKFFGQDKYPRKWPSMDMKKSIKAEQKKG